MEEFSIYEGGDTRSVYGYHGEGGEVVIPDGITIIANHVFMNNDRITSVRIPASVESIGWETFKHCRNLRNVFFSQGLKKIGGNAFENCTALEEAVLPEGLEEIGFDAFRGCKSLKRVVLPESLYEVHRDTFKDCTSLTDVVLPQYLKRSQSTIYAFENTPVGDKYKEEKKRKEEAYLAIRDRVRRKLSDDEVRALKTILVEDNPCVKSVGYYSYYRTLSGGYSPEVVTTVDYVMPLADLAGREPYEEFGMFVRAVVDDTVYLTNGLGPYARVVSFDEREAYETDGRGSYDTSATAKIYASRND